LVEELQAMGIEDAHMDHYGYVYATIPSNTDRQVPTICFCSHVDTAPDASGTGVKPILHRAYQGQDIVLPDDNSIVIKKSDTPYLDKLIGHDIITASGTTLLGADDKAGVAEIMAAAEYLLAHPGVAHGPVRLAFTPDEEIGRGTAHFDVAAFGASVAYTLDGGARGELEYESFSADGMTVVFRGFNTHPGYAKGRMISAVRAAGAFIASLPTEGLSPETTEGYEGYVHPHIISGGVEEVRVRVLLRDFDTRRLAEHRAVVERAARSAADAIPGCQVEFAVEESYRNMREVLEQHPRAIETAKEAIRRAGLEPVIKPIRGGTDGSRLSFMGLPTPNLFAGEHNFHSRLEWVSAQDMDKAVEVIVHLCQIWTEPR
jgi:tripeptide aminopeptidase